MQPYNSRLSDQHRRRRSSERRPYPEEHRRRYGDEYPEYDHGNRSFYRDEGRGYPRNHQRRDDGFRGYDEPTRGDYYGRGYPNEYHRSYPIKQGGDPPYPRGGYEPRPDRPDQPQRDGRGIDYQYYKRETFLERESRRPVEYRRPPKSPPIHYRNEPVPYHRSDSRYDEQRPTSSHVNYPQAHKSYYDDSRYLDSLEKTLPLRKDPIDYNRRQGIQYDRTSSSYMRDPNSGYDVQYDEGNSNLPRRNYKISSSTAPVDRQHSNSFHKNITSSATLVKQPPSEPAAALSPEIIERNALIKEQVRILLEIRKASFDIMRAKIDLDKFTASQGEY